MTTIKTIATRVNYGFSAPGLRLGVCCLRRREFTNKIDDFATGPENSAAVAVAARPDLPCATAAGKILISHHAQFSGRELAKDSNANNLALELPGPVAH